MEFDMKRYLDSMKVLDALYPENEETINLVDPIKFVQPKKTYPYWQLAISGLHYGETRSLVRALHSSEPILPEFRNLLVNALRGNRDLSFKLVVKRVALPHQKRAGRPKENTKISAAYLADRIENDALADHRNRILLAVALEGREDLPFRLILKRNRRGPFPILTAVRDLFLAVSMSSRYQRLKAAGERDAYRSAAESVAPELGIGHKTVEAAYDSYCDYEYLRTEMPKWAKELRAMMGVDEESNAIR